MRELRLYIDLYNKVNEKSFLSLISYILSDKYRLIKYKYTSDFQQEEEIVIDFKEEQIKDIIKIIKNWL